MIDSIIDSFSVWTDAQGLKSKGRVKSIENISLEGIAWLRELILELAVRGKLVPQDATDEPASELLKRIEKELSIKHDKEFTQKLVRDKSTFDPNILHCPLPENWIWCELQDLAILFNGKAHEQFIDENGEYYLINSRFVSTEGRIAKAVSCQLTPLIKDDIAIVMSDVPEGNALVKCFLVKEDNKYSLNQRIGGISSSNKLDINYLLLVINRNKYYLQYDDGKKQTNLKKIQILSCPIPLPPFAEQHRIVAKVDELMALCDRLESEQTANLKTHQTLVKTLLETLTLAADAEELQAAWERMMPHFNVLFSTEDSIEQLKQTILQLAVMGKLVKQDPTDEPASELLKRIAKEKERLVKEGKLKKQMPLPAISEEEKPFELAKGWEWVRLEVTTTLITDGKHGDCQNQQDSGYYFLSAKDIVDEKLNYEFAREINYHEFYETHRRTDLSPGDICMVNTGATVGKLAIASNDPKTQRTTFQKSVAVIKPLKGYLFNEYLKLFLLSETKKMLIKSGGSAINNLLLGDLKRKLLPLPPLSEQHRIVAKVDELFGLCTSLKERLQKVGELKVLLSKTVVEKAVG